ncbi:MAG: PSD1 and planctomycete cytochrome C domain-containing protein [Verrucomicrobiaceae bacterium]|nr:PSD1 and planctomycete cytochrome C domain-containing protein [Verrucomicrobiaceae bacterium]
MFARLFAATFIACALSTALSAADMSPAQRSFFETKIRPVLVKQCYECHSQGAKKLGGKLLLDAPSEMIAGGESGPALIPGKPDESLIIKAVRYEDPEMPPKQRLPEQVVNDFVEWVKMGAPDPRVEVTKASKPATPKEPLWSLKPVSNPKPPGVKHRDWPRDPIDAFVLTKLEAKSLKPAADADARTLVRRLYFDLTGLPPPAEALNAALSDSSFAIRHSSLESLVDSLLASPNFGEKWGRHWLDVARYAESNGNDGLSRNASFPHAWRYRDYVIRAFNDDTPYDRFLTEQLAGDLLPFDSSAQRDRQLIATGLLALGAKPAKAMNDNFEMDVIADQINVIGGGIMGLTVGCARCHDHKTDPISARDYYALAGIFKSTETMWGAAARQGLTAPETPLHELQVSLKVTPRTEIDPILKANPPHRPPAKPAFKYADDAPLAMGAREGKTIADCKLNIDGDAKKLGPAVPRGFISACGAIDPAMLPDVKQSGRLQLARWLTSPQHPLTARVMVNRVWQHLFGEGLVTTPNDFGTYGERPSNPELLDHLAARFMREGWSMKRLIRSIVLSSTYQLSSRSGDLQSPEAVENRLSLFGQHRVRRLDAEELRDTMLAATGELDPQPAAGSVIQRRDVLINELPPLHQPSTHRSVYLLMLRNSMPPELTPFNLPDATTVTDKRDTSALATQSLYLLNNAFVIEQSKRFAMKLAVISDPAQRIRTAYHRALGRDPSDSELRRVQDFLREADLTFVSSQNAGAKHQSDAWAALCQALLASNELRYVD